MAIRLCQYALMTRQGEVAVLEKKTNKEQPSQQQIHIYSVITMS